MVQDDSAQHSMRPAQNTNTTQGKHRNTEGITAAGSLRSILVAVPAPLRASMDLHIQPFRRGGCGSNGYLRILVMTLLRYYQVCANQGYGSWTACCMGRATGHRSSMVNLCCSERENLSRHCDHGQWCNIPELTPPVGAVRI